MISIIRVERASKSVSTFVLYKLLILSKDCKSNISFKYVVRFALKPCENEFGIKPRTLWLFCILTLKSDEASCVVSFEINISGILFKTSFSNNNIFLYTTLVTWIGITFLNSSLTSE